MISINTPEKENATHKEPASVKVIKVSSVRDKKIRFNVLVDDAMYIYGMMYIEYEKDGKQGAFISFPRYQGSDSQYYNICWFRISEELQSNIEKQLQDMINTKD